MNSILKVKKLVVLVLMVTGVAVSCRKDPVTLPNEKTLTLKLKDGAISVNEIDSANVVLHKQGSGNPILQRMIKEVNSLQTSIDGLPAGAYTATFDIYTKKLQNGKSFQYVAEKAFAINAVSGAVVMDGPPASGGNGWKQRLVLSTSINDIIVLIPADVTDPYFEIRSVDPHNNFFHIERTAYYDNTVVAHKQWVCEQDCPGNDHLIYNDDYYKPFTEKIKTAAWKKNEIIFTIGDLDANHFFEFSHTWNQ